MVGKRPDKTDEIARRIQGDLKSGERVVACVHVQRPGTFSAEMEGAVGGAVTGAIGGSNPMSFRAEDGEHEGWAGSLAALGVQPSAAGVIKMVLALTDQRLLLYRASRLGGKPKDLLAEWPVDKVDAIEPPRNNQKLTVTIDGRQLSLETPQVPKFLPDVYGKLPKLLDGAKKAD